MTSSAATRSLEDRKPRKLNENEINYLAFEGGGGKGFAYIGALQVLEQLGVTKHIKGYAGASAGAITALLLSTGFTSEKLEEFLKETDFDTFYDTAARRSMPRVGGCRLVDNTDEENDRLQNLLMLGEFEEFLDLLAPLDPESWALATLLATNAGILSGTGWVKGAAQWAATMQLAIKSAIRKNRDKKIVSVVLQNWARYLTYLPRDMGLFDGCEARNLFERILQQRAPNPGGPLLRNITFREHLEIFKNELLVTGANMSNGTTQIFSAKETPEFPVADAIRISMGLPFIFKPYVIDEQKKGWPPCGTYVDGGLWNNLPFREFDAAPVNDRGVGSAAGAATSRSKAQTLGLRLELVPPVPVRDIKSFMGRFSNFAILGTGETQVLSKYVDQLIQLDTRGLGLIDFNPRPDTLAKVTKRSRRQVWRYFNKPVPPEDLDPADDVEHYRLSSDSGLCK